MQRLPDWELRSDPKKKGVSDEAKAYQSALQAFCGSISDLNAKSKDGKGLLTDARCPVTHIGYANDVEEARNKLERKLEYDWAVSFATFHLDEDPETCSKSGEDRDCKPPKPTNRVLGPYAIEVAVVETREPTKFAKALATTFAANKDKYKAAIEERVIPSRRDAAAQATADAALNATVTYALAKNKVAALEAKLQEAANQPRSAQIAIQGELIQAKVAANAAGKAANTQDPPYEY